MEIEKAKVKHIKKEKKTSPQDNDSNSDREDYKKIKKDIKVKSFGKKNKNIGQTLERLLKKSTKTADPILIKRKATFKRLDDEKIAVKVLKEKKKLKIMESKLGYRTPLEWDKKHQKTLIKITTKGVVKLFNSIYDFRKKIRDEKEKEEVKKDKKSTNFLVMHELNSSSKTIGVKKAFQEDE